MVDPSIIKLLFHGNQLKRTIRTGWGQRGVANAEDVAAHSYGVSYIVLMLSHLVPVEIDRQKALSMAILHDLPEGLTTDIPSPAWRFLPQGIKSDVERGAMNTILDGVSFSGVLMADWENLHVGESAEAQLVHDADKLDMYLQAYMYEQQTGNRQLAEFWTNPRSFAFDESQQIFDYLAGLREKE